jgi:hypothetical protein
MTWSRRGDLAALVTVTAASRWLTRSHLLYDLDSVNFALALDHFDPATHQPHPPGYFLYVLLGRVLRVLTQDSNAALVFMSIAASCGLAILVYKLTEEWGGSRSAAIIASLAFIVSPLAWFHGTVALTYIVEAFFSALIGWFCWRARSRESLPQAVAAAAILGLAAGFRQSSALFLVPLVLYAAYPLGWRACLRVCGTALAVGAAWFVPMLWMVGVGPARYFGALWDLWTIVPGTESVLQSNLAMSMARGATVAFILGLTVGLGAVFFGMRIAAPLNRKRSLFCAVWMCPALLFFTFVFLRFVNSGYLLLVTPPLFALLGIRANAWAEAKTNRLGPVLLATAVVAVNLTLYFAAPLYCTYGEVRRFERDLQAAVARVRLVAKPSESVLVGFDAHFFGYRHAAYYLPEFQLLQYPELKYPAGARVFTVRGRETSVVSSIDVSSYRQVVFFPLPEGAAYSDYLNKALSVLPDNSAKPVGTTGGEVLQAPISALSLLFPQTVVASPYTSVHALLPKQH